MAEQLPIVIDTTTGLTAQIPAGNTIAQSKITGLPASLAARMEVATYDSDDDGIVNAADYAATVGAHTHVQADVADLIEDLSNKQPLDTDLTTIAGLTATSTHFMMGHTGNVWASRTKDQARSVLEVDALLNLSEEESIDLYARITTATYLRKTILNRFIRKLKKDLLWDKIDFLNIIASENSQAGYLNIKSSSFTLSPQGTTTFEVDRGITGDGTTGYSKTGFVPNSGVNLTLNSASVFVYCRTNVSQATYDIGSSSAGTYLALILRDAGLFYYLINDTSFGDVYINLDSKGFWLGNRSGASAKQLYKNGVSVATSTTASTSRPTGEVYLGSLNNAGTPSTYSTKQFALCGGGGSFNATEAANLNTHVQWLMVQLGANV